MRWPAAAALLTNASMVAVTGSAEQTGTAAEQVVTGVVALERESKALSMQVDQFLANSRQAA